MREILLLLVPLVLFVAAGGAATEVEMRACRLTPEVKKELNLTPAQEPRVEKVFSEVAPMLRQIEQAMRRRQELDRAKAEAAAMEEARKNVIALENQCRDRLHTLLKPVLTEEQYKRILEMEDVHRKKMRERNAGSQTAGRT